MPLQLTPVFYNSIIRISENRQIKFEFSISYDETYIDNTTLFISIYPLVKNGYQCKLFVDFYELITISIKLQSFIMKKTDSSEVVLFSRPKRKLVISRENKINRLYFHGPEISTSIELTNFDLFVLQNALDTLRNNYYTLNILVYSTYTKWRLSNNNNNSSSTQEQRKTTNVSNEDLSNNVVTTMIQNTLTNTVDDVTMNMLMNEVSSPKTTQEDNSSQTNSKNTSSSLDNDITNSISQKTEFVSETDDNIDPIIKQLLQSLTQK